MPKGWLILLSRFLAPAFVFVYSATKALAQNITLDGTLGTSGTLTGSNYAIPQSLGQTVGNNLFHSFSQFNLNTNEVAIFQSNPNIQNILSRVTGGNQSVIDGLIRTQSGVNLFLINPSGIIFGQNASLDVGGSFVASTANALQFGNLGYFSATEKNVPSSLLTINPSALLFNQINQSAAIQNTSVAPAGKDLAGFNTFGLRVPDGKSLLLVGGNVSIEGGWLNAFGGRIELGSLAAPGNVFLLFDAHNPRLEFPSGEKRGDVSLTKQARLLVQAADGGDIAVNARNIEILESSRLIAGIGYGLGSEESQAGEITLSATGIIRGDNAGRILNIVDSSSKGKTGNINITAESLSLNDGTQISASIFGQGSAGNIDIKVQKDISFNGIDDYGFSSGAFSAVVYGAQGKAGNIKIITDSISLTNGARLDSSTFEMGDAGNITVNASKNINLDGVSSKGSLSGIFNNVSPGAYGKGGDINLTTGTLSATNGAQIIAATFGQGDAGNISIDADTISLSGVTSNGAFPSGIFNSVEDQKAVGNGGNVTVNVNRLSLNNGGRVSASTLGQGNTGNITINKAKDILLDGIGRNNFRSGVFNDVLSGARGNGGNIIVNTGALSAKNGAQLSAITSGLGNAGNVTIKAQGDLSLDGTGTGLFTQNRNRGDAGNISVNTEGFLFLNNGAQLSTSTFFKGNAGNINIDARQGISLDGQRTGVFSRVNNRGEGNAGKIDVTTGGLLVITDGAEISTGITGRGNAGDITINAQETILSGDNSIIASAIARSLDGQFIGQGEGRNISITTDSLSINNGARIIASTFGLGSAGNIKITANKNIYLDGIGSDGRSSEITTAVLRGSEGNAGDIKIDTTSLSITNGARLLAISLGKGDAGNVTIDARDNVSLSGIGSNGSSSSIFSNLASDFDSKGGNINITTGSFSATDGTFLTVSTEGRGDAGNVTINADNRVSLANKAYIASTVAQNAVGNAGGININTGTMFMTTRGLLSTTTTGQGSAGSININARNSFSVSGRETGVFSRVRPEARGEAGKISISTDSLFFTDEAEVSVSNIGQGSAGNIELTANSISLNNKATIQANTFSGNGGNIMLNVQDLLLLRRGSKISTNAGTAQAGGDSGNIGINSRFIVAVPKENSDITANAFDGRGGNVKISRNQGIFGIEARSQESPTTSDITASSENGVQGEILIERPETEPSPGLIELPNNLVDASQQIAQGCTPRRGQTASKFISTGRGGIPENPYEPLRKRATINNWVTLPNDANQQTREIKKEMIIKPTSEAIVEAQGLVLNSLGEVELVAQVSANNFHNSSQQAAFSCSGATY
ncbi:hypothetical protein NIES2101_32320 [Calothrix sp. HK-06]|nr:hypothetical protein NIES2101_32320 [Calothrix sp. HK-06]